VNKHTGRTLFIVFLCTVLFSSCHRSKAPTVKRYPFTGRVVSIDAQDQSAVIDGDAIPGFMDAMAMSYKIKPASALNQLTPGSVISAEVVMVQPDADSANAAPDYWLENVKVTGHSNPAPKAANTPHTPEAGEDVPDFSFRNQDGARISLRQYRGKLLFVTFIYTRCPFPDFCPRMSSNFAEIYNQLDSNPVLADARLLSLSFDPEHDTPKVLRDYGFSVAHTHDPILFRRWEFAAPRAADLPKIADFFALTVVPQGGLITHTLSTVAIGPDGKILAWYHGGGWQVSDLIRDATSALARNQDARN
jgi:protein SCO1